MFFTFSLATYYSLSSLIRNRKKFLGFGRAHYILPSGSFGQRPPFKDHKRKPSSREIPDEDTFSLLCLTPVPTIFLDELHKNFLDLTLVDQQRLYVDCVLTALEDCLHRGLTSTIIFNDANRVHSLDNRDDPNTTFKLEGHFGSPTLPPGRHIYEVGTPEQLVLTNTTTSGASSIVAFQQSPTPSKSARFTDIQQDAPLNLNSNGSIYHLHAPSDNSVSYPLVNAARQQTSVVSVAVCAKHPPNISSAPAVYRLVVQRNSLNATFSFCRGEGHCISYRSVPVTIRVTKISLATKRNSVSLVICTVNKRDAFRKSLERIERKDLFRQPSAITSSAGNADKVLPGVGEAFLPFQSSQITPSVLVRSPSEIPNSNRSSNAANPSNPSQVIGGPFVAQRCFNVSNNITSPSSSQRKQDTTNNKNVNHRPLPVSRQLVTQVASPSVAVRLTNQIQAPVAHWSKTGLDQHNQQTSAAKKLHSSSLNQHPTVPQPTVLGQNTSNSPVGAVGGNTFGQANAATNLCDPFGWGTIANWGFLQPVGTIYSKGTTPNPAPGVIGGGVNTQKSSRKHNITGRQGATRATVWNTSKPCSKRRNNSNLIIGQGNSHRLLMSRKSSQSKATLPCNTFGWGATQQAAGPWFMQWGAPFAIPKVLPNAVPKTFSRSISFGNNQVTAKYSLPPSCKVIPWSDLVDVMDRRTNKPKILGSGCFGIVKLMKQTSSGRLCAVKINQDGVDEQTIIENLKSEVDILTLLNNLDCVPELFGVTKPNTSQLPVVVQEFVGDPKTFKSTTLLIAIEARVLPEPKAIRVALRICQAVRDIQSRKLLHCDLKADNILIEPGFIRKENPNITIIDFGLSVKMDDKPKYQYNPKDEVPWILQNCCHLAPEVVRGKKPYNVSSEVYSLGMILKHMSYRFGGFLHRLGEKCTRENYKRRPSVEEVIQKIEKYLAKKRL